MSKIFPYVKLLPDLRWCTGCCGREINITSQLDPYFILFSIENIGM